MQKVEWAWIQYCNSPNIYTIYNMYSQKNSNFLRIFWISLKRQSTRLSLQNNVLEQPEQKVAKYENGSQTCKLTNTKKLQTYGKGIRSCNLIKTKKLQKVEIESKFAISNYTLFETSNK